MEITNLLIGSLAIVGGILFFINKANWGFLFLVVSVLIESLRKIF